MFRTPDEVAYQVGNRSGDESGGHFDCGLLEISRRVLSVGEEVRGGVSTKVLTGMRSL